MLALSLVAIVELMTTSSFAMTVMPGNQTKGKMMSGNMTGNMTKGNMTSSKMMSNSTASATSSKQRNSCRRRIKKSKSFNFFGYLP
jgi:hypothetical protein